MTGAKRNPAGARRAPAKRTGQLQAPRLIKNERELVALCLALLGPQRALSPSERAITKGVQPDAEPAMLKRARDFILQGADPLGGAFLRLRSADDRRNMG